MNIQGTLTCPRCGRETPWPNWCDCKPAAQEMNGNEVRFLVVHGKPCEEPIAYFCGPGDWCNNPNHAKRFLTREDAKKVADEMIGSNARVEEHMWCAGPQS